MPKQRRHQLTPTLISLARAGQAHALDRTGQGDSFHDPRTAPALLARGSVVNRFAWIASFVLAIAAGIAGIAFIPRRANSAKACANPIRCHG